MKKELMWICAIMPQDFNDKIVKLCKESNQTIFLNEDVFKFPLHISLKKSFYTNCFEDVKKTIKEFTYEFGKLYCENLKLVIHKKMLWLQLSDENIKLYHTKLDKILYDKYKIEISEYDQQFYPHISLFTKGDSFKIEKMYDILKSKLSFNKIIIDKFVIGSSMHHDEYIVLE